MMVFEAIGNMLTAIAGLVSLTYLAVVLVGAIIKIHNKIKK